MAKPEKKIKIVDGRVFRIKKKWNELSREQKRWILADAKFYYDKMTVKTVCPLTSTKKRELLHKVFQRVRAKGIWIPFDEVASDFRRCYRILRMKSVVLSFPSIEDLIQAHSFTPTRLTKG